MARPFTVIAPVSTPSGIPKVLPASRERHPFTQVNPSELTSPDGKVNPEDLPKLLKMVQDNAATATEPYRTNPLLHGELHRQLAATSGSRLIIKHGLGEQVGGWTCVRARPGSSVFAAVEATLSAADTALYPANKYLVLQMSSSGTYDIAIHPS